jgi:hypothetical protein
MAAVIVLVAVALRFFLPPDVSRSLTAEIRQWQTSAQASGQDSGSNQ